jgi:DNA-binding NarL/FixJ family response regulator
MMVATMSEGLNSLSEKEKAALRLLLHGHDAKSMAATLGLSVHTIRERLHEARRKLGVSSSREAARRLAQAEGTDPQFCRIRKWGMRRSRSLRQT